MWLNIIAEYSIDYLTGRGNAKLSDKMCILLLYFSALGISKADFLVMDASDMREFAGSLMLSVRMKELQRRLLAQVGMKSFVKRIFILTKYNMN